MKTTKGTTKIASKITLPVFLPDAFVGEEEVKRVLGAVESGISYLEWILDDFSLNTPLGRAVSNFAECISPILEDFRKTLGNRPAIINPCHPNFVEMARTADKIAREAQELRYEANQTDRTLPEEKAPKAKASSLLLVPKPPTESLPN